MPMKRYVGRANARPDSRTPRRLTSVINATAASDSWVLYWFSDETAEVMASTPEETETATVRT